jgi:hypothetical protein
MTHLMILALNEWDWGHDQLLPGLQFDHLVIKSLDVWVTGPTVALPG